MMKFLSFDLTARRFFFDSKALPSLSPGQSLLKVVGTCLNRADIIQTMGRYPGSARTGDNLGIECVGYRVDPLHRSSITDKKLYGTICGGGGFAEYVAVRDDHLFELPEVFKIAEAAATPEAFITAFQLIDRFGPPSDRFFSAYVPAAAGGIGSALVQLLKKTRKCNVIASARGDNKCALVRELGADFVLDRSEIDAERILRLTEGNIGVDVIFDCVGSDQAALYSRVIKADGSWVTYGLLGNKQSTISVPDLLITLLAKRVKIVGTTLKTRSDEYKAELIRDFSERIVPLFSVGEVRPIVGKVVSIDFQKDEDSSKADEAFRMMKANESFGRIVFLFQSV